MYRPVSSQLSIYRYLRAYRGELSAQNRWVRLAETLDWAAIERDYGAQFSARGKAALSARVAFGCRVIQLHYGVSDREVVALVRESPYLQYFLGLDGFDDTPPFSSRSVARFRVRIPDERVRAAVRLLHELKDAD